MGADALAGPVSRPERYLVDSMFNVPGRRSGSLFHAAQWSAPACPTLPRAEAAAASVSLDFRSPGSELCPHRYLEGHTSRHDYAVVVGFLMELSRSDFCFKEPINRQPPKQPWDPMVSLAQEFKWDPRPCLLGSHRTREQSQEQSWL